MEKLVLLVCTIFCVNELNGMEQPKNKELEIYKELSSDCNDVKKKVDHIIIALRQLALIKIAALELIKTTHITRESEACFNETLIEFSTLTRIMCVLDITSKETYQKNDIAMKTELPGIITTSSFNDIILIIKMASTFNVVPYDTIKLFTRLMNVMSKRFPNLPRKTIAETFDTPTAHEYIIACNNLIEKILSSNYHDNVTTRLTNANELLNLGADPSFSWYNETKMFSSLLSEVYYDILNNQNETKLPVFTLLLNHGAKPDLQLVNKAVKYAKNHPTELNKTLSQLLNQTTT